MTIRHLFALVLLILSATPVAAQFKVYEKNLQILGFETSKKAFETAKLDPAVQTAVRFCQPRMDSRRKLFGTLKRSKYLRVFSDLQNGMVVWGHASGAPMILTIDLPGVALACGSLVGKRVRAGNQVKRLFEKYTRQKLRNIGFSNGALPIARAWGSSQGDPVFFAYSNSRVQSSVLIVKVR